MSLVPARPRDDKVVLPGLSFREHTTETVTPNGDSETNTYRVMETVSSAVRRCDNCYVSQTCPAFSQGSECKFEIPVAADTPEQRAAIRHGVIAMQTERVAFLKFGEQVNGGYVDPNLSSEMKLLFDLMTRSHEIEDDRDSFEMTVKGRGHTGMISRIFGAPEPPRYAEDGRVLDVQPEYTDPVRTMIENARTSIAG